MRSVLLVRHARRKLVLNLLLVSCLAHVPRALGPPASSPHISLSPPLVATYCSGTLSSTSLRPAGLIMGKNAFCPRFQCYLYSCHAAGRANQVRKKCWTKSVHAPFRLVVLSCSVFCPAPVQPLFCLKV
jgi:hypothetical protein